MTTLLEMTPPAQRPTDLPPVVESAHLAVVEPLPVRTDLLARLLEQSRIAA